MIALDTSILVRFFAGDDPAQSPRARRLVLEELTPQQPGYVSLPVVVELIWVLERIYKVPPIEVRKAVAGLLESPTLVVEQASVIAQSVLLDHEDLADGLVHLLGRDFGCTRTVTFDRKFARLAGVELLTS